MDHPDQLYRSYVATFSGLRRALHAGDAPTLAALALDVMTRTGAMLVVAKLATEDAVYAPAPRSRNELLGALVRRSPVGT